MRDFIVANAPAAMAIGGLLIGFVFGWIVFRTSFCTMGSISDFISFGDYRRFRASILAAATALIGAQVLNAAGVVDLGRSLRHSAPFLVRSQHHLLRGASSLPPLQALVPRFAIYSARR